MAIVSLPARTKIQSVSANLEPPISSVKRISFSSRFLFVVLHVKLARCDDAMYEPCNGSSRAVLAATTPPPPEPAAPIVVDVEMMPRSRSRCRFCFSARCDANVDARASHSLSMSSCFACRHECTTAAKNDSLKTHALTFCCKQHPNYPAGTALNLLQT